MPITVSVVIPCLDEAGSIANCIARARAGLTALGVDGEIVVADNGSRDGSPAIAEGAGARVVHVAERGYGSAVRGGLDAARGEIAVMGDADATYDFGEMPHLVHPILAGEADLVVGSRLDGDIARGAMPWANRYLGTPTLTWLLNTLYGLRIADSQSGLRAFRAEAVRGLGLRAEGMEFASEMLAKAARSKLRILEVPIRYARREGAEPHLRPLRDGWRHLRFLLLFGPVGLFALPGSLAGLLGALLLGLALFEPRIAGHRVSFHFAILGGTLLLLGLQVLSLGLYARSYSILQGYVPAGRLGAFLTDRYGWRRAVPAGALLATVGSLGDLFVLATWVHGGLGPLPPTYTGAAIASSTLIVLGFHLCFWALLLEVLHARERRR